MSEKSLARKLLDVACRIRVGETLLHDDEIVDEAAHALAKPAPDAQPVAFKEALHQISLCSQNSMSSKEECGRIARAVLKAQEEKT